MSQLDHLRQLLAAATPGPWEHWPGHGESPDVVKSDTGMWATIGYAPNTAALIAAAVNALPALLRVAEAASEVLKARLAPGGLGEGAHDGVRHRQPRTH
jgi:hypothetical protein